MKKRIILIHLMLIIIVSLGADLLYINSYGLYSDDWAMFTDGIFSDQSTFNQYIKDTLFRQWEMRPLRAIEYIGKRIAFSIGGIPAIYGLQSLLITLSMMLFYIILIKRIPTIHALFLSLIFSLSPLDTTTLWIATMHYRYSLLFCLIAIYLMINGKKSLYSGLFLIFSLLICEVALGLFLLSPFLMIEFTDDGRFNKKLFYPVLKKTIITFVIVFALYLLWRLGITQLYMEDIRVNNMLAGGLAGVLVNYLNNFLSGYRILFVRSINFLLFSFRLEALLLLFIFCIGWIGSIIYLKISKIWILLPYSLNSKDIEVNKKHTLFSIYYIIMGLISALLSYWLGSSSLFNEYFGVGTRFNFVAGIAFAFFYFGILLSIFKIIDSVLKSSNLILFSKLFLIIMLFAFLITHRIHIQKDYVKAWDIQKNIISSLCNSYQILPENKLVILRYQEHAYRAIPVFDILAPWQIHFMAKAIYGPNRIVKLEDYIQEMEMNGGRLNIRIWYDGSTLFRDLNLHPEDIVVFSSDNQGNLTREEFFKFVTTAKETINVKVNTDSLMPDGCFMGDLKLLSALGISFNEFPSASNH